MSEKVLMKGNEAFGEAAIRGGARFYFGYPITPQNEVPEFMSRELNKRGGQFVQAESELAAVNMAYGAAAAGGRVFISTSSPGFALMQEGMSFMASAEIPVVAMNVSRGGPGVGGIQPGQADYFQATRGGGNGDYHIPVFAPSTLQEAVDMIYEAFEIADKYRNPVLILADGMMGQMMEPVVLPEQKEQLQSEDIASRKPWALTGWGGKEKRSTVVSLHMKPDVLEECVEKLFVKYRAAEKELVRYETHDLEGAQVVFVAFGTMARIVSEAMEMLGEQGIKAGMIRPQSLWPYPYCAFDEIDTATTKVVISTELSMGQMLQDVNIGVCGRWPTDLIYRTGGIVPTSLEIVERTKKILEGLKK
ncbi:MAG: 3-methyl-2-oxobutanoate dehydrogenase subunit VorB [Oscillospiraceae bacterium]|nr:3-methyl-2-oxobutanoate dehydrogenase subunit VorB [Oscillospiraceae bacterium]